MDGIPKLWVALARSILFGVSALAASCEPSDSEVPGVGGASGKGGSSGAGSVGGASGTGGVSGMGGVSGTGGASAMGGTAGMGGGSAMGGTSATAGAANEGGKAGGSSGMGGDAGSAPTGGGTQGGAAGAGACSSRTSFTLGTHMLLNVTWPSSLATSGGDGVVHVWDMRRMEVNGTGYTAEVAACGILLPPASLSALAGGGDFQIEIPDASWDLEGMPSFQGTGTIAGFAAGSAFAAAAQTALLGLTLDPATGSWPSSPGAIMTADHDSDSKPGITGVPKTGAGFVRPPTSILGQSGAVADEVYIVTRLTATLEGAFTSCTDLAGTADVDHFDNHVVGCHVFEGAACSANQSEFIDSNRTVYEVGDATFESKILADTATCADVRTALPL